MRIFKRISSGMFNPTEVNFYVEDKKKAFQQVSPTYKRWVGLKFKEEKIL